MCKKHPLKPFLLKPFFSQLLALMLLGTICLPGSVSALSPPPSFSTLSDFFSWIREDPIGEEFQAAAAGDENKLLIPVEEDGYAMEGITAYPYHSEEAHAMYCLDKGEGRLLVHVYLPGLENEVEFEERMTWALAELKETQKDFAGGVSDLLFQGEAIKLYYFDGMKSVDPDTGDQLRFPQGWFRWAGQTIFVKAVGRFAGTPWDDRFLNGFQLMHRSLDASTIDPPVIDPPVIDPPVIDPPVVDPPVVDPPVIDPPVVDPLVFSDVTAEHWAYEAIAALSAQGMISGYEIGGIREFRPGNPITRGEFVSILVKAFDLPQAQQGHPFLDVHAGDWYETAIGSAYEAELISGKSVDAFAPKDLITREELATICGKVLLRQGISPLSAEMVRQVLDTFQDSGRISGFAQNAVALIRSEGFISGYPSESDGGKNEFRPGNPITRGETASILFRMLASAG